MWQGGAHLATKKKKIGTSLVAQEDSTLPMQGARVHSLVRKLDAACQN